MKRNVVALLMLLVALLASSAVRGVTPPLRLAQEGEAKKVKLKIIVPQEDATLWIFDVQTKQTGTERQFVSSELKPVKEGYYYELKVTWEPNNYTTITRTRKVSVQPGKSYDIDLSKPDPNDKPDDIKVRYVPTPDAVVDKMIEMAKVGKDDVVFDLGCGDGRMVCRAIKNAGAKRGVGVDIDPERIKDSNESAKKYKVTDKVKFREGDVLKQVDDLSDASVVLLYMGDEINLRLRPMLRKTLKPGSRVVSHRFLMGDWKPDRTEKMEVDGEELPFLLHLWTIRENVDETKGKEKAEEKVKEKDTAKEKGKEKAKP